MLKQDIEQFFKSKTNWLGLGSIVGGIIAFQYGGMAQYEAGQMVVAGFAMIFLRDGIAGVKNAK